MGIRWTIQRKKPVEKKTGFNLDFERIYPEREGYERIIHRHGPLSHVGYITDRMETCSCGATPVLEQYVEDVDENGVRNAPAKVFVAICPKCELKAAGRGTLETCIRNWNAHRYSNNTIMVRGKLENPDMRGCEILSNRVLADAVMEAVALVKRKHELMVKLNGKIDDTTREIHYGELQRVRSSLRKLASFFHDNPIVFTHDEEAILSGIRRSVYPYLSVEERLKIPLNLLRM